PISLANGKLLWSSDGRTERGVSVAFEGALVTGQSLRMALRLQTDPNAAGNDKPLNQLEVVDVGVRRLSLTGSDKKILVAQNTGIGAAMDRLSPKGFADVDYAMVRAVPGAELA